MEKPGLEAARFPRFTNNYLSRERQGEEPRLSKVPADFAGCSTLLATRALRYGSGPRQTGPVREHTDVWRKTALLKEVPGHCDLCLFRFLSFINVMSAVDQCHVFLNLFVLA